MIDRKDDFEPTLASIAKPTDETGNPIDVERGEAEIGLDPEPLSVDQVIKGVKRVRALHGKDGDRVA